MRDAEFHSFKTKLSKGAPNEILGAILVGICRHVFLDLTCCLPHSVEGTSNNPVAEAYNSQPEIRWGSLLRGCVSIKWQSEYQAVIPNQTKSPVKEGASRSAKFIRTLVHVFWEFSKGIWSHRCKIIHCQTEEFWTSKEISLLRTHVNELYHQFFRDSNVVPCTHCHWFNCPVQQTIYWGKDTLNCWIKSVEEAMVTQALRDIHMNKQMAQTLRNFMVPKASIQSAKRKQLIFDPVFKYPSRALVSVPKQHTTASRIRHVTKKSYQSSIK